MKQQPSRRIAHICVHIITYNRGTQYGRKMTKWLY